MNIPENMKRRPVQRGMAVPWGATIDAAGTAHFAINDTRRMIEAIVDDKCFLCGRAQNNRRWFIGGCRSAFDPKGAYLDPPVHKDCAEYALQTCPFIAAPAYGREIATIKAAQAGSALTDAGIIGVRTDENARSGRPPGDLFVAVECIGQTVVNERGYLKPKAPYKTLGFWKHGQPVKSHLALEIIRESAPDIYVMLKTGRAYGQ